MEDFIALHKQQFVQMGFPDSLLESVASKIMGEMFDIGNYFMFSEVIDTAEDLDEQKTLESALSKSSSSSRVLISQNSFPAESQVFLIDHMWTTTQQQARSHLKKIDGLVQRIASFFEIDIAGGDLNDHINSVLYHCWPKMDYYIPDKDGYTRWCLPDEVGMAIMHKPNPNFKCCPLIVFPFIEGSREPPYGISVLWNIQDVEINDVVSRNYLPTVYPGLSRELMLVGFLDPESLRNESVQQLLRDTLQENKVTIYNQIPRSLSLDSDPQLLNPQNWNNALSVLNSGKVLKIFCDRSDHLSPALISRTDRLILVESPEEADALFLIDHVFGINEDQEYRKVNKILNQFWWNGMIVSKDQLSKVL